MKKLDLNSDFNSFSPSREAEADKEEVEKESPEKSNNLEEVGEGEKYTEKVYEKEAVEITKENDDDIDRSYNEPLAEKYGEKLKQVTYKDMADDPIIREQMFAILWGSYGVLNDNIIKLSDRMDGVHTSLRGVDEGIAEKVNEGRKNLDDYVKSSQIEVQQVQQVVLSAIYQHFGVKFDDFTELLRKRVEIQEEKAKVIEEQISNAVAKLEAVNKEVTEDFISKKIYGIFWKIFAIIVGTNIAITIAVLSAKNFIFM